MIQSITLRSHVGVDGQLHLNIPTDLTATDLEVIVLLKPVSPATANQPRTFSERWRGKFKGLYQVQKQATQDLRFQYLMEHHGL
jgi:hypothetical protein